MSIPKKQLGVVVAFSIHFVEVRHNTEKINKQNIKQQQQNNKNKNEE